VDRNYQSQKQAPFRIQQAFAQWQQSQADARSLRERNNALQGQLKTLASSNDGAAESQRSGILEEAKALKQRLSNVVLQEDRLLAEMQDLAYRLPNLTSKETPIGGEPRLIKYINPSTETSTSSSRVTRSHVEIGERLQILDWAAARTASGTGWYFLVNEGAMLEQALIQYALSIAMKRGWKIVSPPSMVYSHIVSACGFLPRDQSGEQQIYTISQSIKDRGKPEYSLTGTAEIPLAAMKANETLREEQLPFKVIGTSRCYRAEAGARGVQSKGLYRVHEFSKVEMFAWTGRDKITGNDISASSSPSATILQEMVDIQTTILESLNLRCRVLEMPSYDLGGSAFRKQDIEAYFPSRRDVDQGWGEVTSASICTDYQTRRLATRLEGPKGDAKSWPYTVNGTAMAVPRVIAAILENGWDEERGVVHIPEVLRPWMGGSEVIERK
jgi:seryl-tRNA synthetase